LERFGQGLKPDGGSLSKAETNARSEKIDDAVSRAGELVGALLDLGPINPAQAKLIVTAAVRAAVPNYRDFETRASATRIAEEFARFQGSEGNRV
jgi:hypothetical protein